jgi:Helix-turn-helix.
LSAAQAAVAPRKDQQSRLRTKLARERVKKGVTQEELARATGVSMRTVVRMEGDLIHSPCLAWYVNAATALGVRLEDVIEERHLHWIPLDADGLYPPPPGWIEAARGKRAVS